MGVRLWLRDKSGQSLIEAAVMLPVVVLMVCYAAEFGAFFIAATGVTASARNGVLYATQGSTSSAGGTLPPLGGLTTPESVAGVVYADLASYVSSTTTVAVQLCTNNNGTVACGNVSNGTGMIQGSYQPDLDPENALFQLARVDVVYTVNPPIPLRFFSVSLVPSLNFHRMAEMRVLN